MTTIRSLLLICALAGVGLFASCDKMIPDDTESGTASSKKAEGPVLAEVSGEAITLGEFDEELSLLPEYTRNRMKSKEQKVKRLEGMIDAILLRKEAKRKGIDQDKEILRKVARYRDRLITEKLYRQIAEERSEVTEERIKQAYEERRDQYMQKERVRVSQILILVPPNAGPDKDGEAKAKADEVLQRARKGEDFTELAKGNSEGPTASRGGDLGYFSRGRMVPEFEEVAFSLNPGDISDVVKTKFGYHIIKMIDRQKEEQLSLDAVRDRIVRQLESQQRREIRQTLAKDLRQDAQVTIHTELLGEESVEEPAGEKEGQPKAAEAKDHPSSDHLH